MSTTFIARKTPAKLGYRMPAEWEPHAATWLTWPRPGGISFPGRYEVVPPIYAELIRHLVAVEEVHINVWDADMKARVRQTLIESNTPLARVHFHTFPASEPWCRDHGPIFVSREYQGQHERAVVDWAYNAWGGKYPPYDLDDAVPERVAEFRGLPLFRPGIVMEGGSIEVNGRGTLLTTEACLLNPNRNPNLSKSEIEQYLRDYLGVTHILWLGEGIVGDDTDGHIDDLARFVNPTTVVCAIEEDSTDANYETLQRNLQRLERLTDVKGRSFEIITLPMPGLVGGASTDRRNL